MDLDQAMQLERPAKVTSCTTRLLTWQRSSRPGTRWTSRRINGASRCTARTARSRCTRRYSVRGGRVAAARKVRPAFVWTLALDTAGELTEAKVERARVKSRQRLDYVDVQREPSRRRRARRWRCSGGRQAPDREETERGGVSLPMPEQEIDLEGDRVRLEYRAMLPVETWNAQISLLTGFAAARMMMDGKVGILRTLPPPASTRCRRCIVRQRRWASAGPAAWVIPSSSAHSTRPTRPKRRWWWPARAAARGRLRLLQRTGARSAGTRGPGLAVRPRHGTAASAGRRYGLEICAALSAAPRSRVGARRHG